MTLMIGTLISISSNSLLEVWMGLEINLLCFIPLISTTNNLLSSESTLKYFFDSNLCISFSNFISYLNTFTVYMMITSIIVLILYMKLITHIKQTFAVLSLSPVMKLTLFINLLSLGRSGVGWGLTTILGFLPKWLVIQYLVSQNQMPLLIITATSTLVTLFYNLTASSSSS